MQFLLNKDIVECLVCYLNQIDLSNLAKTCKHYNSIQIIKDCLQQTYKFLNAKLKYEYSIFNFQESELFCKVDNPNKNNKWISNTELIYILVNYGFYEDELIFIRSFYTGDSYICINANNNLINQVIYINYDIVSTSPCYGVFKLFKIINKRGILYKLVKEIIDSEVYPPCYFEHIIKNNLDNFELYYKVAFNKKRYVYTLNTGYLVYEFNNNDCKSKIAYVFIDTNECNIYEINNYYIETNNNLFYGNVIDFTES